MQNLLYYPGFEPPNSSWLKFAILYCENFQSIVPYERRHLLTEDFRLVVDSSDLVELYNPGHYEADRATIRALTEMEAIISKPYRYSSLFNRVNALEVFRDPANWTNVVYESKFTREWVELCLREKLGLEVEGGILISEGLAYIFMTHLAKEVAARNNKVLATDNNKYDNYTSYAIPSSRVAERRASFARSVVTLSMPANIGDISMEKVLSFRCRNRELIRAFNAELALYNEKIGEGNMEGEFLNRFKNFNQEMYREFFLQGMAGVGISLSAYVLIKNGLGFSAEYMKEMMGIVGGGFGGVFGIKKALLDSRQRRDCGKYFANLSRLN